MDKVNLILTLAFSNHRGNGPLRGPYTELQFCCDDEEEIHKAVESMANGDHPFEPHVTVPFDPKIRKIKPEEACFNVLQRYRAAVDKLLETWIITDTGMHHQGISTSDDAEENRAKGDSEKQQHILDRLTVNMQKN